MAQKQVVDHGMVVSLQYSMYIDDELLESTDEEGPIEFLQGYGEIIPGLEQAIAGMATGDEKDVTVGPEDGYGEYEEDAVEEVPLDIFPDDMDLSLGMPIELYDEESEETVEGFVTEVRTDTVLVDLNHPLAGETLTFKLKVLAIRPATADELAHGHAHGHDHGHDHGDHGHE